MAEKVYRKGSDIITSAIFKQIDVLEEMQGRAMTAGRSDVVLEISDKIFNAVECYDKHINSDCYNSESAFDKALYGKSDPVLPPSPKLLQTAIEVYGHLSAFKNIDGLSCDGIIERIREAEIEYWKHK